MKYFHYVSSNKIEQSIWKIREGEGGIPFGHPNKE